MAEHPQVTQKERDLRTLEELLDSEGWSVLCDRVLGPDIAKSMRATFEYTLRGQHDVAAREAAHGDALIQLIVTVYKEVGRDVPESIKRLRKGHANEYDDTSD